MPVIARFPGFARVYSPKTHQDESTALSSRVLWSQCQAAKHPMTIQVVQALLRPYAVAEETTCSNTNPAVGRSANGFRLAGLGTTPGRERGDVFESGVQCRLEWVDGTVDL